MATWLFLSAWQAHFAQQSASLPTEVVLLRRSHCSHTCEQPCSLLMRLPSVAHHTSPLLDHSDLDTMRFSSILACALAVLPNLMVLGSGSLAAPIASHSHHACSRSSYIEPPPLPHCLSWPLSGSFPVHRFIKQLSLASDSRPLEPMSQLVQLPIFHSLTWQSWCCCHELVCAPATQPSSSPCLPAESKSCSCRNPSCSGRPAATCMSCLKYRLCLQSPWQVSLRIICHNCPHNFPSLGAPPAFIAWVKRLVVDHSLRELLYFLLSSLLAQRGLERHIQGRCMPHPGLLNSLNQNYFSDLLAI